MMVHQTSRRTFLKGVAGGAALLPAGSLSELSSLLAATSDSESYWQMIRWQFPFREERVPMNAANLCPSPLAVAQRVTELTRDIDIDCSFNNRAKFPDLLEESRHKVAEHLGVSADEVALVRNTSEANNIINNGLALKKGDEVVLWDQNHPTNNVAWDVRAARFDLIVKRVTTPGHPTSVDQLVEIFEKAFSRRTRVLAITHVSNVSGLRLPVRELCEIAHRRGIYVHVDGAQSWGALNVNQLELGCDSYAASAHKWFVGPKEAGLLYVRRDRIPEIWPSCVAPGWGDDIEPDVKGARKFESLGQRDDACLAAIGTTASFHQMVGPSRIEARVYHLANTLKAGLKEIGAKLVTPEDPRFSAGVCIIEVPEERRKKMLDRLYHEYGIAGAPTGGLRLCPHLYNTMEHIERALEGVKAMRRFIG
ncbi:aminotransferase class V-fold PLP-dependent enzyme [Acidobacteria bacterium AH-259-A15]|nr:aminotransferase class V-fold PLP-dependent enzyme [Acidobacteria bacterium AH-259-A15]